jgi:Na+/melibiose symporter-like transporter
LGAKTVKTEFKESLKTLSKDKNFILLFISFSVLNGTFNVLGALMNYLVAPFGYSDVLNYIYLGSN